jgi:dTDP-4-amino-4,6-dideoxygalactose transaminase
VTVPRLTTNPPLPPTVYLRRAARPLPWPLGETQTSLYARARHGLWQGLRALGIEEGDEILLPAWQHGSEIEAVERAGCRPVLYDVDPGTVAPDPSHLDALLTDRTKALHLIHYLGWPRDPEHWRAWCDDRGLHLIEDCAQALLSTWNGRPLGSFGSMSIYCIYKTVGVPDGAALHCSQTVHRTPARGGLGVGSLMRSHAEWALRSRNLVAAVRGPQDVDQGYDADDFALGDPDEPPARSSASLWSRLLNADVAEARRKNFASLSRNLEGMTPEAFRSLPPGISPLVYPVRVPDKKRFLSALAARGVIGLNLWTVPHPDIAREDMPGAASLRAHLVGLPVHQELTQKHIDHIGRAALESHG